MTLKTPGYGRWFYGVSPGLDHNESTNIFSNQRFYNPTPGYALRERKGNPASLTQPRIAHDRWILIQLGMCPNGM